MTTVKKVMKFFQIADKIANNLQIATGFLSNCLNQL